MKIGVITFPGSNCDQDCLHAVRLLGHEAISLWHGDDERPQVDALILPGGFSYGDYLRCGALARFAPMMQHVHAFAREGKPVLGICNGFQILIEAGLLPGALLRNQSLKFICKQVYLKLECTHTPFSHSGFKGQLYSMPIAHGDGNYFADTKTLNLLEEEDRVVFRYVDSQGKHSAQGNPNGSSHAIAGIRNERGNVVGMMPHPERAMEALLGSSDGRMVFDSLIHSLSAGGDRP